MTHRENGQWVLTVTQLPCRAFASLARKIGLISAAADSTHASLADESWAREMLHNWREAYSLQVTSRVKISIQKTRRWQLTFAQLRCSGVRGRKRWNGRRG